MLAGKSRDPCRIRKPTKGADSSCERWHAYRCPKVRFVDLNIFHDNNIFSCFSLKDGAALLPGSKKNKPFQKICARLSSGVRFGIGIVLERSCGLECSFCTGNSFHRKCRYFSFRPHYRVKLEKKKFPPTLKVRICLHVSNVRVADV